MLCLASPYIACFILYCYDHLVMKSTIELAVYFEKYFDNVNSRDKPLNYLPATFELYIKERPYIKAENFMKISSMYYPRPIILMIFIRDVFFCFHCNMVLLVCLVFWSISEISKIIYNNSVIVELMVFTTISLIVSKNF